MPLQETVSALQLDDLTYDEIQNQLPITMDDREPISILAVGDIMLGFSSPHSIASKHNIPANATDGHIIDSEVKEKLYDADIVFGNLECVISSELDKYDESKFIERPPLLMAPDAAARTLSDANFTVLNVANNHILDHGREVAEETLSHLRKSGIAYVGDSIDEEDRILNLEYNSNTISFLSYDLCVDNREEKIELIYRDIESLKTESDFIIISLHWGFEHVSVPSKDQVDLGRSLVDAGADAIFGHHSHVFEPIELYKNKPIAYSLGNFVFDMWREENLDGGILELTLIDGDIVDVDVVNTSQRDYTVFIDNQKPTTTSVLSSEELDELVTDVEIHEELAINEKKLYYFEMLRIYLRNFFHLPLKYHWYVFTKWSKKLWSSLRGRGNWIRVEYGDTSKEESS